MTKTMQWDEEFLKTRERDEQETAFERSCQEDWDAAVRSMKRARSHHEHASTRCWYARCRRIRRCALRDPICLDLLRKMLPPHVEQSIVEDVYADKQIRRREVAMAKDEKG